MEELIKLVSERAGISSDQAKAAVETVLGFLKERLPEPIAAQVDGLLASGAVSTGNVNNVIQGLGGLFGRR
jgi:uncharacterized protein (DUF2267 family)